MAVSQSLPDLVRAAQDAVKPSYDRISEIWNDADGQPMTSVQGKELADLTVVIELAAVDIFTVFEARMQRHFKRGPLSRKVKAALLEAGEPDLADRLHQHYLAINVLKHGTGASHRELLSNKSTLLVVKHTSDSTAKEGDVLAGLIDVTPPHFFDGLAGTILDAYDFLETR